MASPHNCLSSIFFQVVLEKHGSLTTENLDVPAGWECPVCLEGKDNTTTTVTGCKCSKVACRLKTCNHLIHVGCYQSLRPSADQKLAVCPTCQVASVWVESDEDRAKKAALEVPVPAVIETVTMKSIHGQSKELRNISSKELVASLYPAALEIMSFSRNTEHDRVRLISFNRALELDKKISDYPGLHLNPIFLTRRL